MKDGRTLYRIKEKQSVQFTLTLVSIVLCANFLYAIFCILVYTI